MIFDCVTSTKQQPIKIPKFEHDSDDFVDLEIVKGKSMVKTKMLMDENGSIFWLHCPEKSEITVLRHNPKLQMGNPKFITKVFKMYAEHVFFFEYNQGLFYIMDETHKIKALRWNEDAGSLVLEKTLQYYSTDSTLIKKTIFDDFMISSRVLHNRENMFFVFDSNVKPHITYF